LLILGGAHGPRWAIEPLRGSMQDSKPSSDGERPVDNPYAPPRSERGPGVEGGAIDEIRAQRQAHLRRESCVRVTGLLCLILAVVVILSFGLGTLFELRRIASTPEETNAPWVHQRWVFRMTCVNLVAVIAAITSFGLYKLQNWGRWALTMVTALPALLLASGWLLLNRGAYRGLEESVDPDGLIIVSVVSALFSLPSLFLMWSPKGRMVFSPGYRETIRQTPDQRPGWWGILPAVVVVPAALVSYIVLTMTMLLFVLLLGLIRSI
jgi:hypothetical protein